MSLGYNPISYEFNIGEVYQAIKKCNSETELEKLYNEKLSGKRVNIVDEVIIKELFLNKIESFKHDNVIYRE